MKNLILINGTMGIGKTATSRQLQKLLPKCVFLDGDWCWDMSPFVVNEDTKRLVLDNITHMLNNFLSCDAYENILFCWVMHEQSIIEDVLSRISGQAYALHKFSLLCSPEKLRQRIMKDVDAGVREAEAVDRSLPRLQNYRKMDTTKIYVDEITPEQAAKQIYDTIYSQIYR